MKKRFVSVLLSIFLISSNAAAAEFSLQYDENILEISGSDFLEASTVTAVLKSENEPYTLETDFAIFKVAEPDESGKLYYEVKFPKTAVSGYYTISATDGDRIHNEDIFFINEELSKDALKLLEGEKTATQIKEALLLNSDSLGISEDLAKEGTNIEKLAEGFTVLKPTANLSGEGFISAYLGSMLCTGGEYTFDEFLSTVKNNAYALGCEKNGFLKYDENTQKMVFEKIRSLKLNLNSFDKMLAEASFLTRLNLAQTKTSFEDAVFKEFSDYLALDLSVYSELRYPENVIMTLMQECVNGNITSSTVFSEKFKAATDTQKNAENRATNSGGSSGGGGGAGSSAKFENTEAVKNEVPSKEENSVKVSPFSDIEKHWAEEAVMYLKQNKIIDGVSENLFAPEKNVTRAEFTKMICCAFFEKSSVLSGVFEDVPEGSWYAQHVYTLFGKGIIKGVDSKKFAPNNNITREDAAVIIERAASNINLLLSEQREDITFTDESDISEYALSSVHALYRAKLLEGVGEGAFGGKGVLTRAQAAQMIYNMLKRMEA